MVQDYETHTSQLCFSGGIRHPDSNMMLVAEPQSLLSTETRKGSLYVVIEAAEGSARGEACQLVTTTIKKAFYKDSSLSITASLRGAIRAGNRALYHYNLRASAQKRAHLGATCAVIKGTDLFVAQVMPSQIYILSKGEVRAIPLPSLWRGTHSSVMPFMRPSSLGSSLHIEPELSRSQLFADDALLICSTNLSHVLTQERVHSLLAEYGPNTVVEQLHSLCQQNHFNEAHACTLRVLPMVRSSLQGISLSPSGIAEYLSIGIRVVRDGAKWLKQWVASPFTRKTPPKAPLIHPGELDSNQPTRVDPNSPYLSPSPIPMPREINLGESMNERYEREQRERAAQRRLSPHQLGEGREEGVSFSANSPIELSYIFQEEEEPPPYRPRYQLRPFVDMRWYERLAYPFLYLRMVASEARHTLRMKRGVPYTEPMIRSTTLYDDEHAQSFPWFTVFAVVGVVAVLVAYGFNISRRNEAQHSLEYLEAARQHLVAASDSATTQDAVEYLEQAQESITQVRESHLVTETNPTLWIPYREVVQEYEQSLRNIQRLTFFEEVTPITTHPDPKSRFASVVVPPPTTPSTDTFSLQALQYIYAMDASRNNANLYRIPRGGGEPELFLSSHDAVKNIIVGSIKAITWRVDNIVAIDENSDSSGLYYRRSGEWDYLWLGGSQIWAPRGRIDLETYDGHLYVWGAEDREILKYINNYYHNLPYLWLDKTALEDTDLTTAVDMAIDGNIYLLLPNGNILAFSIGMFEREIVPEALHPPINTITRFSATGSSPEQGSFFLLDTMNERVIQLEKTTGAVIQQIKVRPTNNIQLDQLTDIYVDEGGTIPTLYLVNGRTILRALLPDAPPRSAPSPAAPPPAEPQQPPAPNPSPQP